MKSFIAKSKEVKKEWYYIDAKKRILGRLASYISYILRGKNKVIYTPHIDVGDYLIVINAKKIIVSGKKKNNKIYYSHSRYPGGLKKKTFKELMNSKPEKIIIKAVKGMLPKGPLGRRLLNKLKVYSGSRHKHISQNPKCLTL